MFMWLMQQPMVIFVIGIAVSGGLAYGWLRTSRRGLIYAAGATLLCAAGVLVAEQSIETDEEAIRRRLREIASAVEKNDHQAVLSLIAKDATECRRAAEYEMPTYEFKDCYIANIKELEVDHSQSPQTARALFLVWVYTTAPQLGFHEPVRGDRLVELTLREQSPKNWVITGYSHWDPRVYRRRNLNTRDPADLTRTTGP